MAHVVQKSQIGSVCLSRQRKTVGCRGTPVAVLGVRQHEVDGNRAGRGVKGKPAFPVRPLGGRNRERRGGLSLQYVEHRARNGLILRRQKDQSRVRVPADKFFAFLVGAPLVNLNN